MDDAPFTGPPSPSAEEFESLRSEVGELTAVLRLGLAGLFVVTGSLGLYLFRQDTLLARQVAAQVPVLVDADQKNRGVIAIVNEFQRFGWAHPDYATNVLARFNLVPLAPTNAPASDPKR